MTLASQHIRIGSRESELAQAQARHIMGLLKQNFPELESSLVTFKTTGDLNQEQRLSEMGEKGLFTKELEIALLDRTIDIAVHSMKDMPGELPEGLLLTSAGLREDPRDVLISNHHQPLEQLPPGSIIGTSSTRRIAMLKRCRPDLICKNIRGNLQTRLKKLEENQYDAILLAAAGVHRLGWHERITQYLNPEKDFVPAPGQGILGIEYRQDDPMIQKKLEALQVPQTQAAMVAERAVLIQLESGCHTPLGAHAKPLEGDKLLLTITLLSPDGQDITTQSETLTYAHAESQAKKLAQKIQNPDFSLK